MRKSKKLEKLAQENPEVIQSYYFHPEDGHWLYLNSGWICPEMECGTIHEYTVGEVMDKFKTVERVSEQEGQ